MPLNFENEKRELWRLANIHMNTFNDALDKIADYAATIDEKIDSLNVADQRLKALEKQLVLLQPLIDKHYKPCGHCGTYVDKDTPYNCSNCERYFCEGCIDECMPRGRLCFMCKPEEATQ